VPTCKGKYTIDLLLDAAEQGLARTYTYELLDAYPTGSRRCNAVLFATAGLATRAHHIGSGIENNACISAIARKSLGQRQQDAQQDAAASLRHPVNRDQPKSGSAACVVDVDTK